MALKVAVSIRFLLETKFFVLILFCEQWNEHGWCGNCSKPKEKRSKTIRIWTFIFYHLLFLVEFITESF